MELSLLKEALGIDLVINPENAAAAEIARLLRFPLPPIWRPFAGVGWS